MRLAQPVYADVLRARMPVLRLRSIAATLAAAMGDRPSGPLGPRDNDDLLRMGRLLLLSDADEVASAGDAASLDGGDMLLAAQIAGLQGRWREADDRLRRLTASARDDAARARVAIATMDNCLYAGLPAEQLVSVVPPRGRAESAAAFAREAYVIFSDLGGAAVRVAGSRPRVPLQRRGPAAHPGLGSRRRRARRPCPGGTARDGAAGRRDR